MREREKKKEKIRWMVFREQRSWLNRYDYRFHAISRIAIKERSRRLFDSILNRTLIVRRSQSAIDQWLTRNAINFIKMLRGERYAQAQF